MSDFILNAANRTSLFSALLDAGVVQRNESRLDDSEPDYIVLPGFSLDVIGPISKLIGYGTSALGQSVPILEEVAGFHANLRGFLSDEKIAMLPLIETPKNLKRRWA